MKKLHFFLLSLILLTLTACGYQVHNIQGSPQQSILGNGSSTVSIGAIEQSSLYPWVPHFITTTLKDEMSLRQIAKWESFERSDYLINVNLSSIKIGAFDDSYINESEISSASVVITLNIHETQSGKSVWNTRVGYSENYENPREDSAIREVIEEALKIAMDNLQSTF